METKIFDPADGFGAITDLSEITDATLVKRDDRWWMFAAGQLKVNQEPTSLAHRFLLRRHLLQPGGF